ncbi:MAG: response regulator [Anaerolineae bacterium]|nr:response regulator [Anaerolineae bacterium]
MSTILVAEDEAHILLLIQRKLEALGYTVLTTANGDEALKIVLEDRPDLLILDVMLPGREGLDVCREVKTTLGDQAPPVILISALGLQRDVEKGINAGANAYIIKPFSPRTLVEHVENALRQR